MTEAETIERDAVIGTLDEALAAGRVEQVIVVRAGDRAAGGHDDLRLGYCLAGERRTRLRGALGPARITWGAGSAVLFPPGVVNEVTYRAPGVTRTLGLVFRPDLVRVLDVWCTRAADAPPARRGVPRWVEELPRRCFPAAGWHALRALEQCDGHETPAYRRRLMINVLEDTAWMLRRHAGASALPPAFLRVQEYVREHFTNDLDRDEVAAAVRMHPNHVSRLFREHAATTFSAFLARLRLERAAELLADPLLSVKEVTAAAGFGHPSHFYRSFRDHYGMSPGAYQRQFMRGRG